MKSIVVLASLFFSVAGFAEVETITPPESLETNPFLESQEATVNEEMPAVDEFADSDEVFAPDDEANTEESETDSAALFRWRQVGRFPNNQCNGWFIDGQRCQRPGLHCRLGNQVYQCMWQGGRFGRAFWQHQYNIPNRICPQHALNGGFCYVRGNTCRYSNWIFRCQ